MQPINKYALFQTTFFMAQTIKPWRNLTLIVSTVAIPIFTATLISTFSFSAYATLAIGISPIICLIFRNCVQKRKEAGALSNLPTLPSLPSDVLVRELANKYSLEVSVKHFLTAAKSRFLQAYLEQITPETAMQNEGIDSVNFGENANAVIPGLNEYLVEGLKAALQVAKTNTPQLSYELKAAAADSPLEKAVLEAKANSPRGLKRMNAALLAMQLLKNGIAAKVITIFHQYSNDCIGEIWANPDVYYKHPSFLPILKIILSLSEFAARGKKDISIEINDTPYPIRTIFKNINKPDGLEPALENIKKDKNLPALEKEILCQTILKILHFIPHLKKVNIKGYSSIWIRFCFLKRCKDILFHSLSQNLS